jgi:hypothetical protein
MSDAQLPAVDPDAESERATGLEPGQKPGQEARPGPIESGTSRVLREILSGTALMSVLAVLLSLIAGGVLIAATDPEVQSASGYFFARPLDTLQAIWQSVSGLMPFAKPSRRKL